MEQRYGLSEQGAILYRFSADRAAESMGCNFYWRWLE